MENVRPSERLASRRGFFSAAGCGMIAAGGLAAAQEKEAAAPAGAGDERMFELGTVTYNIAKDWDLDTLLEKCEELGIAAVELRTTHKHGVEPTLTEEQRAAVRERFSQSSVALFGLGSACEFHSTNPEVVKQNIELTNKFIHLAHDLGAVGVKVRPNGLATKEGIAADATLKQIGLALRECGDLAVGFGVEIWLEVHGNETQNPPNMRKILDHCKHPAVGITWNSNMTDVKNGSVKESFALLGADIRCVHINELWSDYPYRELFSLLRKQNYARYTMAEIPASSDPERLLRYYRKLWDELSRGAGDVAKPQRS